MPRVALGLEYLGTGFSGWQRQSDPNLQTVQGLLEQALSSVADEPIGLVCAGRTDAGVHATGQTVHFDTTAERDAKAWIQGVNSKLPRTIRVNWARPVPPDFHARFSAVYRRYNYLIYHGSTASAFLYGRALHVREALDRSAMNRAAAALLGEQDFSAFRAAGCQSSTPMREVSYACFTRRGQFLVFEVQANAFLLHMVRNLVGSLLEIGKGRQSEGWIAELLAGRDRTASAMTAPPDGLYLVEVGYGAGWGLPRPGQQPGDFTVHPGKVPA